MLFLIVFLYITTTCSAQVFEGHPFIVEAGVSVGGNDVKQVGFFLLILEVDIQCLGTKLDITAISPPT